jgi:hypothetical protein
MIYVRVAKARRSELECQKARRQNGGMKSARKGRKSVCWHGEVTLKGARDQRQVKFGKPKAKGSSDKRSEVIYREKESNDPQTAALPMPPGGRKATFSNKLNKSAKADITL